MKYQRTKKAILQFVVFALIGAHLKFGKIFTKWALEKIKDDYPLFFWGINRK